MTLAFHTFNAEYRKRPGIDTGIAESVAQLLDWAFAVDESAGGGYAAAWFRGCGDADWRLIPKDLNKFGFSGEQSMYGRFRTAGHMRREHCPGEGEHSVWLSLMQHHGSPTRLLDWTESILVAAYFVIWQDTYERISSRPGAIWMTYPGILNENLTGDSKVYILDDRHLFSLLYSDNRTNLICAASPVHRDVRMMVQHGRFTVHDNETPLDEIPNGQKALRRVIIPPQARPRMARELARCGITRESLFPDFDNLSHHLRFTTAPSEFVAHFSMSEVEARKNGSWFADDPPFKYPRQLANGLWEVPGVPYGPPPPPNRRPPNASVKSAKEDQRR